MASMMLKVMTAGATAAVLAAAGQAHGQTFLAPNSYTTPTQPECLTVADFTGDGLADVVVGCTGAAQIAVFGQTAGGLLTLGGTRTIAGTGQPVHVNAMHIDFLGTIDLVVADGVGPLQALQSNGSSDPGTWSTNFDLSGSYVLGSGAMASTGFSIEPFANAVVAIGIGTAGAFQARVGDGDGTYEGFQQGPVIELGTGAVAFARGRLDAGPLEDDVVMCVPTLNVVKILMFKDFVMCSDICWRGYAYSGACALGPGEVAPPNVPVGPSPVGVVLGQFDPAANANTDMAVLCGGDDSIRIFRGNGNGTFTAVQTINVGQDVVAIAAGDLNLDNRADLAVLIDPPGATPGSIAVYINGGTGTFSAGPTLALAGNNSRSIAIADLSFDGKRDIAALTRSSNSLVVFRNSSPPGCIANFDSTGGIGVPDIFAFLSAWFGSLPAADVNQNGSFDVPDIFAFLARWFAGC